MVCFGAVVVEPLLQDTFYGQTAPIPGAGCIPEALAVSGFTREEHEAFRHPQFAMQDFLAWLKAIKGNGKLTFISDNPAFDWQFINYYLINYTEENPFGFSARRIGDLYCGMKMHAGKNSEWKKKLRKTSHTHHPVDDARGNAEALLAMQKMGLHIKF